MAIITVRSDDPNYHSSAQLSELYHTKPTSVRLFPKGASIAELPDFQPVPDKEWKMLRLLLFCALIDKVGADTILHSNWNTNKGEKYRLYRYNEIEDISRYDPCWPENAGKNDKDALFVKTLLDAAQHFSSCGELADELGYVFEVEIDTAQREKNIAKKAAKAGSGKKTPEDDYIRFKVLLHWFVNQVNINNGVVEGRGTNIKSDKPVKGSAYEQWAKFTSFSLKCSVRSGFQKNDSASNYIFWSDVNLNVVFDKETNAVVALQMKVRGTEKGAPVSVSELGLSDEGAPNDVLKALFDRYSLEIQNYPQAAAPDLQVESSKDCVEESVNPQDDLKAEFQSWARGKLGVRTIYSYCNYIKSTCPEEPFEGYTSPFQISDSETLRRYMDGLSARPDFQAHQYRSNAGSALKKYEEFLFARLSPDNATTEVNCAELSESRNLIVFGAPGTGKSFYLEKLRKEYEKGGILGEKFWERVTFHPDYTYANFVGTYKPAAKEDGEITYKFVPGPFLRLLVKALNDPDNPYLLIIEEINRAEPAAVFGDVFQLLDRDKDHKSEYDICPSEDMKAYLAEEFRCESSEDLNLYLPANFYLWATMNSADQGVFPMDTAFKRRWDFKYIGVDDNEDGLSGEAVILQTNNCGTQKFCWNKVRKEINNRLAKCKINEDKQLGPFFLKLPICEAGIDSKRFAELFKNKVLMYLFEDAARQKRNTIFEGCRDETRFSKICEKFDQDGLKLFGDEFCKDVCLSDEDAPSEQALTDERVEEAPQGQAEEIHEEAPVG